MVCTLTANDSFVIIKIKKGSKTFGWIASRKAKSQITAILAKASPKVKTKQGDCTVTHAVERGSQKTYREVILILHSIV